MPHFSTSHVMKRKLASIQSVLALDPIPNADAIELARIQGWQCVVRKGEFQVGDSAVFLEIDSIPPDEARFAFLWQNKKDVNSTPRPEQLRLKTLRLRGALSQGLLLHLNQFPEIVTAVEPVPGQDLTDLLSIVKWEPVLPASGEVEGAFPPGIPKTDETRIQSMPELLEELAGKPYVITLKCDGTSTTIGLDRDTGEMFVCSRNWRLKRGPNAAWRAAEQYPLEAALQKHPSWVIQAELVGPGIQKNRLGLPDVQLRAFSVFDQASCRYLDHHEAVSFLAEAGVPPVPVLEQGECFAHDQSSLLNLAEGLYEGTQNEREGLVIRPQTETFSPLLGGRFSFKAISNRFLLKGGD